MGQNRFPRAPSRTPYVIFQCLVMAFLIVDVPLIYARGKQFESNAPSVTDWPVPNEPRQLFYLQRDPDTNTVIYQLNTLKGRIDPDNPINVFWIRYAEGDERKPLNYIQRTMAFGMTHRALENGDFELKLVSYKDLALRLSRDEKSGKYVVYTQIAGTLAILDRIYVRVDGGSTLNPNIEYFELSGRDASSGRVISERMIP